MTPEEEFALWGRVAAMMLERGGHSLHLELSVVEFYSLVALCQLGSRHPHASDNVASHQARAVIDRWVAALPEPLDPLREMIEAGWDPENDR